MKFLLVAALLVTVTQIMPSCDGGSEVVGWIEEKYIDRSAPGGRYMIVINTVHYEVPFAFWENADVGDLVKYDGRQWTIVRKRV